LVSVLFLLTLITISSAVDMSIIGYDTLHTTTHNTNWRTDDEVNALYESWLVKHGKTYNAIGEKDKRFQIFKDNLKFIDEHNLGDHSYKLGLNKFADLTNEEYRATYTGVKMIEGKKKLSVKSDRYAFKLGDSLPDSVDWRESGAVTEVKDQGSCGLMDYAFEFIIKNGGIDTEEDYPYTGRDGRCDANKKNAKVVTIDGYEDVPVNDEASLKKAVVNQPIAVAIEAGGRDFQFYTSGIFTGSCGTALDHGVLAVGYGTENGKDYWIVKNSWGAEWGESGYLKMERNIKQKTGICGIAMEASYPIKTGDNPPNPGPTPPSPAAPEVVCDEYSTCPESTTCCCIYEYYGYCFAWGCCPLEGASCCEDHYSCCPHDYPICNVRRGTCSKTKNSPLEVNAIKRILATPTKLKRSS
ncbi:hypothetical protein M8C21_005315, partial [Ambrosia artemisiifolia]